MIIEAYMHEVALSNDYATLKSIGKTVEKRDIWQLKIFSWKWITGATCIYGINLLSTSYGSNPKVTALLDKYDVYIIPIMNPDGYAYTWSNDRLWRKNRNKYKGAKCSGVDLNRNFDDHFGGKGSSGIPCSQIYRGPSPASELETKATQAAIIDLVKNAKLKVLYSIHSYSQLWMHPHGWKKEHPKEAKELKRVSRIGMHALTAVHGTKI
ncbi:putative metallocarboxypeptidase A [Armadillidium nasatum]|uniref:Putative metallocarboxypeptidase A n=1 Tax=Armadillidium nasatum TaxID=96803 RepID=A0A5N5SSN6_9CRUS|nr:putative metallocarboxypeptidase A [Armadillidium nasatum]